MSIEITPARPDSPAAIALIEELEGVLAPLYPDESRHGYSVEKLLREGVAFFVAHVDDHPAGCGGVQIYEGYAELKRMYTRPAYRGRGLARLLLDHLATHAAESGISVLRLETGIHQHAAVRLYERTGFTRIPPFGGYTNDPNSIYYEKTLG